MGKYKKTILLFIIIVAVLLRFWKLNEYPALNADEAAIGYNVYSLIQTGKDEHGNPWPIHFQSFNDYKPGLYFYMIYPLVIFLGLSEWSVRIPGAALGVLTVFILYLLVKELRINYSLEIRNCRLGIGEVAAFILAISPWHIHFSRGGWEVNVATFFMVLGVWLFLKGLDNILFIFFSSLAFALSLYTYHSERVVVPLLLLGLLIIYKDYIGKYFKYYIFAALIGFIAILPLIKDFTRSDITSRVSGVGLFADTGPLSRINEQRSEHHNYTSIDVRILHNKLVNYSLAFADNWAEHYHGEFLFLSGDPIQRNRVPETGEMYLFDLIFIIVGLVVIIRTYSQYSKSYSLILWWLIVAPVAASLTFQSPHALRAHNMVIPLVIISTLGLSKLSILLKDIIKSKYLLTLGYILLATLISLQFFRYLHMYWVHMAKEYPFSSQYGVKELVKYIMANQEKYKKVIVSDRYDQPYILFLFYMKYAPDVFQKEHLLTSRDRFGFSTVREFGKFEFVPIYWDSVQPNNPNSLIVGTPEEIPDTANIVKEIYGSNGYKYFEIVAN